MTSLLYGAQTRTGNITKFLCFSLLAFCVFVIMTMDAEAARRRKSRLRYAPPYAAMAVDLHTGRILHAKNANEPRYPASLTKVMTLYLLFDALRDGKLTMKSELKVSAHAASQAPSKLYLDEGDTISVADAIGALVTKSANDVAVVVAEALAPTEEEFARLMTQKARTIGMLNTTFRNASGLPNPDQRTTAQDLTIMARNVLADHPTLSRYFNTKYFNFGGDVYRNHNTLLFSYQGMEGMKTGFTNASGFNLIATAQRGDKRVLAVVVGGSSSRARNASMRNLMDTSWNKALTQIAARKAGVMVADLKPRQKSPPVEPQPPINVASVPVKEKSPVLASIGQYGVISQIRAKPDSSSTAILNSALEEGLKPRRLAMANLSGTAKNVAPPPRGRTEAERRKAQNPDATPADNSTDQAEEGEEAASVAALNASESGPVKIEAARDLQLADLTGLPLPQDAANMSVHYKTILGRAETAIVTSAITQTRSGGETPSPAKVVLAAAKEEVNEPQTLAAATAAVSKVMDQPGPFHVQVGAFGDQAQAEERLESVAEVLGEKTLKLHPKFTMPVAIPSGTMFRARLARFQEGQAKSMCNTLKRKSIDCIVIRVQ